MMLMGICDFLFSFEVESKHSAFYTGGNIQWIEDTLYCQTASAINLLDVETGSVTKSIGNGSESEEVDSINTFTTDGTQFVTSHESGLLKLWSLEGTVEKMWKSIHKGPIAKLSLNGSRLASGGSDGRVRIWDLQHQACLLALKCQQGVVNVVENHPHEDEIFASADDGVIDCFELSKGQLKTKYEGHFSKVTSIAFSHNKENFVSCGRDKVIILWQFNKSTALKAIAVNEAIEVIVSLPQKFTVPGFKGNSDGVYVASVGENGIIRVWDVINAKTVYTQTNSLVSKAAEEGGLSITHLMLNEKSKSLAVVSVDHNIAIHHLKSFTCLKQFVGFSDDILDIAIFGQGDSHIVVATNSNDIKLYENTSMSCQLLKGHEDFVLSLAVSPLNPNLMVSAGKDNSVRLWQMENAEVKCIGVGKRHTHSIKSVCFFPKSKLFVSASDDTCLKVWEMPQAKKNIELNGKTTINCKHTVIAHEKEINCVTVSPNDMLVATASQDKTVKLWKSERLEIMGVLKGHKRGVWSAKFSPVDQVIVTSSADCTIRLWSVANLTCLKTLEGHDSSVIKADFLSKGLQVISVGADGLIKLFNLKNSECQCTLEQHDATIWALAIKSDESGFITGGSDSQLIKWKDVTMDRKEQKLKELEEVAVEEQKLSNYIQSDQLLKALKLSLKLEKPMQSLKIVQGILKKGDEGLPDVIKSLRNDQKESLMNFALNWNMNSRNTHAAQLVLNILLKEMQTSEFRPVGLSKLTEQALPYTERHFKRVSKLMQDANLITYTLNCMQPHARSIGE
ncbi:hypothetical protein HUJ04_007810 [Dendroctonus ponderosae]|nr:hypothetical protein HUJ04_007810 [Dendroctonus ponderosae]